MNQASRYEQPFPIPAAAFEDATERFNRINQDTEIELRRETLRLEELFERISDEVVAQLNAEQVEPSGAALGRVVRRVFEKYFGKGIEIEVYEQAGEGCFGVRSCVELPEEQRTSRV